MSHNIKKVVLATCEIVAVKIKPSSATTAQDIYYVLITIVTCFGSFNGNLQAISHNTKY
jgi:hypothetical protein